MFTINFIDFTCHLMAAQSMPLYQSHLDDESDVGFYLNLAELSHLSGEMQNKRSLRPPRMHKDLRLME